MRNLILLLHRWAALLTGAFLVVIALSGALISLENPLDRALNPGLFSVPVPLAGTPMLSLDTLAARAAVAGGAIGGLSLPSSPGGALVASGPRGLEVFLNPYSGAVLGTRTSEARNAGLVRKVRNAHEQLLAGDVGSEIVGATTAITFLVILGGMILWWKDRVWRVQFRASWKRIVFDLHHLLGIAAAVVLLIVTATGVWMHYRAVGKLVLGLDRTAPPSAPVQEAAPQGGTPISIDSAVQAARTALAGAELRLVTVASDPSHPYVVGLRFPEDRTPGGRSRVFIDRYTGVALQVRSTREAELGTRLSNLQRSLHTGDVLGTPTVVLWFLASLAMASQCVTGVLMWWNGRAGRKARAGRKVEL